MKTALTVQEWMEHHNLTVDQLVELSKLGKNVVDAIVQRRYTPSPTQRQQIAVALQVEVDQIVWGHDNAVDQLYGHGPQFGRSP